MQSKIDLSEIDRKNKVINRTIERLKSEFIGIDEQIEQVMDHVRTWYLYPQLQTSPVVVCLWGLTGIGKTSLLKKIAKYLDIEEDLVYFNFAEINEMTSYDVETNIEEQLSNEKSNRMFVYDEFQYAATLDGHGEEKDNKNGLKPFWELLDTGVIKKRVEYWGIRSITRVLFYMAKINEVCEMRIENGKWVNTAECLSHFSEWDCNQFSEIFKFDKEDYTSEPTSKPISNRDTRGEDFFIRDDTMRRITDFAQKVEDTTADVMDIYHKFFGMTLDEMIKYLSELTKKVSKGYELNFNESIIFVVGNLDEAYNMAFDVNPDMSPDQFHKITKKISVVEIKQALQKRFRNEQIARMGNTHIPYPSFSSDDFRRIIDYYLNQYKEMVKELSGYDVEFDKSLKNILFKESVYPTHGTRPVFSTIQELVKTRLPNVAQNLYDKGIDVADLEKLVYSYKNKHVVVTAVDYNGHVVTKVSAPATLKLDNLRSSTKDDRQALTALHESGHFVAYAALTGELPERVVTRTAAASANGFMLEQNHDDAIIPRKYLMNEMAVALGGYVAEEMFFGADNLSVGASADLARATGIASRMVRCYGMGEMPVVTTHIRSSMDHEHMLCEEDQKYIATQIKGLVNEAVGIARRLFEQYDWRRMLRDSAKYLTEHSEMPKKVMKSLFDSVDGSLKVAKNDRYYRDAIDKMLN